MENSDRTAWLETVINQNVEQVGGKNASLGELISALKPAGIRVPGGFAIMARAYRAFVDFNQLTPQIEPILSAWERGEQSIEAAGQAIRRLFRRASFPDELANDVRQAYQELSDRYQTSEVDVAVRSSATAEDLPDASFASQQETFLNISGEDGSPFLSRCSRTTLFARLWRKRRARKQER